MVKKVVKKTTVKKKPAKQKATPKKLAVKKKSPLKKAVKAVAPVKPPVQAKSATPVNSIVTEEPLNQRAPVKKVVNMPTQAPKPQIIKPAIVNQTAADIKPAEVKVVDVKKIEDVKPQHKVSWNLLPKYLPAQVRFLVQSSMHECEKAAGSPFPFAKFISSLPSTICGLEFALLILSLEHDPQAVSNLCKLSVDQVDKISNNASQNFTAKISNDCGDMFRKLRTQLAGSGLTVDTLTEQYVIQKVDKNFQIMLGAVILKSLGAKNLNYQPTALAS